MFWNKKNKNKKGDKAAPKELSSEEIRAQALANARSARENLGDDTVKRIAEIMGKKKNSAMGQAKATIQNADTDRVVDSILDLRDED